MSGALHPLDFSMTSRTISITKEAPRSSQFFAITISWSSIGTPEKAVGLGQMAAKVAGSIAAAQNAPLTSKPLFFRCRITSFILQRIPRSSEGNHHGAVR